MSGAYLPGDTRQRIQDLIKDSSITQAELAGIIGLSESAFSRYLKGQTEMLGDGYIIKIAKHFNVSTDFLLGETNIPDRKNYDIEELGISAEAAKLLYTGRLDSRVLNLLLENPHFPQLLALLARYQKEIVRSGIAAMNQQLTFINSLLLAQAESVPDSAGAATQLAADLKGVRMPATIGNGTFLFGAGSAMTNDFILAGGNLAAETGSSNALGALTVTTNATLTVEAGGQLSFASFVAGSGLQPKAVIIDAPLTGDCVRIGTDASGLTAEQRTFFRWKDGTALHRVRIDGRGYLHPLMLGIVFSVR